MNLCAFSALVFLVVFVNARPNPGDISSEIVEYYYGPEEELLPFPSEDSDEDEFTLGDTYGLGPTIIPVSTFNSHLPRINQKTSTSSAGQAFNSNSQTGFQKQTTFAHATTSSQHHSGIQHHSSPLFAHDGTIVHGKLHLGVQPVALSLSSTSSTSAAHSSQTPQEKHHSQHQSHQSQHHHATSGATSNSFTNTNGGDSLYNTHLTTQTQTYVYAPNEGIQHHEFENHDYASQTVKQHGQNGHSNNQHSFDNKQLEFGARLTPKVQSNVAHITRGDQIEVHNVESMQHTADQLTINTMENSEEHIKNENHQFTSTGVYLESKQIVPLHSEAAVWNQHEDTAAKGIVTSSHEFQQGGGQNNVLVNQSNQAKGQNNVVIAQHVSVSSNKQHDKHSNQNNVLTTQTNTGLGQNNVIAEQNIGEVHDSVPESQNTPYAAVKTDGLSYQDKKEVVENVHSQNNVIANQNNQGSGGQNNVIAEQNIGKVHESHNAPYAGTQDESFPYQDKKETVENVHNQNNVIANQNNQGSGQNNVVVDQNTGSELTTESRFNSGAVSHSQEESHSHEKQNQQNQNNVIASQINEGAGKNNILTEQAIGEITISDIKTYIAPYAPPQKEIADDEFEEIENEHVGGQNNVIANQNNKGFGQNNVIAEQNAGSKTSTGSNSNAYSKNENQEKHSDKGNQNNVVAKQSNTGAGQNNVVTNQNVDTASAPEVEEYTAPYAAPKLENHSYEVKETINENAKHKNNVIGTQSNEGIGQNNIVANQNIGESPVTKIESHTAPYAGPQTTFYAVKEEVNEQIGGQNNVVATQDNKGSGQNNVIAEQNTASKLTTVNSQSQSENYAHREENKGHGNQNNVVASQTNTGTGVNNVVANQNIGGSILTEKDTNSAPYAASQGQSHSYEVKEETNDNQHGQNNIIANQNNHGVGQNNIIAEQKTGETLVSKIENHNAPYSKTEEHSYEVKEETNDNQHGQNNIIANQNNRGIGQNNIIAEQKTGDTVETEIKNHNAPYAKAEEHSYEVKEETNDNQHGQNNIIANQNNRGVGQNNIIAEQKTGDFVEIEIENHNAPYAKAEEHSYEVKENIKENIGGQNNVIANQNNAGTGQNNIVANQAIAKTENIHLGEQGKLQQTYSVYEDNVENNKNQYGYKVHEENQENSKTIFAEQNNSGFGVNDAVVDQDGGNAYVSVHNSHVQTAYEVHEEPYEGNANGGQNNVVASQKNTGSGQNNLIVSQNVGNEHLQLKETKVSNHGFTAGTVQNIQGQNNVIGNQQNTGFGQNNILVQQNNQQTYAKEYSTYAPYANAYLVKEEDVDDIPSAGYYGLIAGPNSNSPAEQSLVDYLLYAGQKYFNNRNLAAQENQQFGRYASAIRGDNNVFINQQQSRLHSGVNNVVVSQNNQGADGNNNVVLNQNNS